MSNYELISNSEGDFESLQQELRFKIGEQYELNEFNLKCIESTFSNGLEYDNYEYIKDDIKAVFGVELSCNIILQYNADILSGIIYKIAIKDLDSLIKKLNDYLTHDNRINKEKLVLDKTFNISSFQEMSLTLHIERDVSLSAFRISG